MDVDSILYALAGLGLIFLGAKTFTHNLQSITGPFVRFLINKRTDNLFLTHWIGVLVSVFVQNSMGISYILLAYMSAGLMSLGQGIFMLLGAQWGLSSAAWFLNVGFDTRAMFFLLFMGFIPALFGHRFFVSQLGRSFFGLGLILLGIEFFDRINLFLIPYLSPYVAMQLGDSGLYKMFLLVLLVAASLTALTRSKLLVLAIAFAILRSFSFGPLFSLAVAIGLSLGGTLPQLLLSFSMTTNTRRLAWTYLLVNLLATVLVLVGLEPITRSLFLSPWWVGGTGFAAIYSLFSLWVIVVYVVSGSFLFRPLLRVLIPKAKHKEAKSLRLPGYSTDVATALAIDLVEQELKKMSAMVEIQLDLSKANLLSELGDRGIERRVSKYEKIADNIELEVRDLITHLMQRSLLREEVLELRSFLSISEQLENLSDSSDDLVQLAKELRREERDIPKNLRQRMSAVGNLLQDYYLQSFSALMEGTSLPSSQSELFAKIEEELRALKREQRELSQQSQLSSDTSHCLFEIYNCFKRMLFQAQRFAQGVDHRSRAVSESV